MFDHARKEGRHKGARPSGLSVQVRMSKPEKRTKYNPLSSSRLKVLYLVTVVMHMHGIYFGTDKQQQ
jgi:Ni,Fe-hydrogenase I cytochrome b subunit